MLNVCFMLGGFTQNGGIGRVTSLLVDDLCQDYNVFTLSYAKKNVPNIFDLDPKVKQEYLLDRHQSMTKTILTGGMFKLRKFLKENDIDILIASGALYFPLAIFASKGTKTKCICWEHANIFISQDHKLQGVSRYIGIKFCDKMVVLTKTDMENIKKRYNMKNLFQIYNPVDQKLINKRKEYNLDSQKIMSVGRLTDQKNYPVLVEIADEILKANPNWTWEIYGDGVLKNQIQSLIDKIECSDRLILKGQVDNVYDCYADYSFLVMTSKYEGFPMVLLESVSSGLPMVSFDIHTGPNEIIEDSLNGFLIEPFDKGKMIDAIQKIINDEKLRKNMSDYSVKSSKRFSKDYILKQWRELL